MATVSMRSVTGLSPLARGTHTQVAIPPARARFIPAGAGNTVILAAWKKTLAVYPRWRGEHVAVRCWTGPSCGLSPLARGTPTSRHYFSQARRFIPAGAGNTHGREIATPSRTVYPRWRGEHSSIYASLNKSNGLSPLARGTQRAREHRFVWWRFIPAGAGNTGGIQRSTSV